MSSAKDDAIADEIYERALAQCYRTDPCDRSAAEAAFAKLVKVANIPQPSKVAWSLIPPNQEGVEYWVSSEVDRGWCEYYAAAPRIGITDEPEACAIAQALIELLNSCHLCIWFSDSSVVLVERPEIYTVDNLGRPHSFGGRPDLMYRDDVGTGTYHWHGIRMPGSVIRNPEKITLQQIKAETNAERRRVMIALYGEGRWLIDSKAVAIDSDDRHGRLYRLSNNELVLICQDGVEQLDGSRPSYSLRLNAELRPMKANSDGSISYGSPQSLTALNAAASTYGLTGDQYLVSIRT